MKHSIVSLLLIAAGFAACMQAQTPAAQKTAPAAAATAGGDKVAVIAFEAAVAQTNEFQRDYADLVKKYEPRRRQLKTLSDEVDSLTKQLQNQGSKLSEAQTTNMTLQLDEKKKKLSRDTEDAQNDYKTDVQQMLSNVAQKVGQVLTTFAQVRGYTLVLDAGQEQTSLVLYSTPATDITQAVIDAYNQQSGIPAPAAQTSEQPAAAPSLTPEVDAPEPTSK